MAGRSVIRWPVVNGCRHITPPLILHYTTRLALSTYILSVYTLVTPLDAQTLFAYGRNALTRFDLGCV